MGSLCSTIYDDVADPSEGQFMYQPKNGKKIEYYSKREEQNRINEQSSEREEQFRKIELQYRIEEGNTLKRFRVN